MRAIFISYRRDDSEGHAGRLFEDLCERFGKNAVFMDVAGIEPGRDFRRVIEQQVASCGVLLAIIGKNWLTVTDAGGKRRLDDPYDFVRLETASALKRDIPVIPVLVHDGAMPRAEQLPDDLKDLAFRNSVELNHARWGSDVQLLIQALLPYVDASSSPLPPKPAPDPGPVRPRAVWVAAPLAVLALGGIGYVAWERFGGGPAAEPPAGAASVPDRLAAASAVPAPAASSLTAAPSPAPIPAPTPAPLVVAAASAPKPEVVDKPIAPSPAASRHIDKPAPTKPPVAAPASPAPRPAPSPGPAPAPSPMPTPAPAPAPTPAPSIVPSPIPAAPPEIVASPRDPSLDLFGSPGSATMVTRTITIKSDTSYVNVTGGEVIRFDVEGKSFVWNFNGTRSSFDLSRVAPPSVLARKVTAYVAPNPMYPRKG